MSVTRSAISDTGSSRDGQRLYVHAQKADDLHDVHTAHPSPLDLALRADSTSKAASVGLDGGAVATDSADMLIDRRIRIRPTA
jgi:hypothetical protein